MLRRTAFRITAAALAVSASFLAQAASPTVEARLKSAGIQYVTDEDGDFKVTYNYSKEGRTQLVFVSGSTQEVGSFEVREIFSPAGRVGTDGISNAKAMELIENNRKYKLGAWEISGDVLYFVIKLPESLSAKELESAMDIAAETADDMEIELSGDRDDL